MGNDMPAKAQEPTLDWKLLILEYARSRNQPMASLLLGAFDEPPVNVPFSFVLAHVIPPMQLYSEMFKTSSH